MALIELCWIQILKAFVDVRLHADLGIGTSWGTFKCYLAMYISISTLPPYENYWITFWTHSFFKVKYLMFSLLNISSVCWNGSCFGTTSHCWELMVDWIQRMAQCSMDRLLLTPAEALSHSATVRLLYCAAGCASSVSQPWGVKAEIPQPFSGGQQFPSVAASTNNIGKSLCTDYYETNCPLWIICLVCYKTFRKFRL